MISFLLSVLTLFVGYHLYSRFVERVFMPDDRKTPAYTHEDGVDFIPLPLNKTVLIQLLNIAGTGPIFGAIMGAVFGPIVFLWIVLGSIFAGAVHDYMSGMLSERQAGESMAEVAGKHVHRRLKWIMRFFLCLTLILCGTVFTTSPAALLAFLTPQAFDLKFWTIVILVYYFVATLLPIDKIIGRLYPVFGATLFLMVIGISVLLLTSSQYTIPEITLTNQHPNLPIWPFMFVTVACGAISGFHSTQSPMMARCLKTEKDGRKVFYGAMIIEALIALTWAAAGVAFYENSAALNQALATIGQSGVIYQVTTTLMGPLGGVLAVIGVIVCPITSGDTAFRGTRLILAETFSLNQKSIKNRLLITVPLLIVGAFLTQINFDVLWRYFAASNQFLATVVLWVGTVYLFKFRGKAASLLTALPATFMTGVVSTYILMAKEGFALPDTVGYGFGCGFSLLVFCVYGFYFLKKK